jgi:hypothetical protein
MPFCNQRGTDGKRSVRRAAAHPCAADLGTQRVSAFIGLGKEFPPERLKDAVEQEKA